MANRVKPCKDKWHGEDSGQRTIYNDHFLIWCHAPLDRNSASLSAGPQLRPCDWRRSTWRPSRRGSYYNALRRCLFSPVNNLFPDFSLELTSTTLVFSEAFAALRRLNKVHAGPVLRKMTTLGPLTTIFIPSPSCTTYAGYTELADPEGGSYLVKGPLATDGCYPSGFKPAKDYYYTPGQCPSGYTMGGGEAIGTAGATPTYANLCCPVYEIPTSSHDEFTPNLQSSIQNRDRDVPSCLYQQWLKQSFA